LRRGFLVIVTIAVMLTVIMPATGEARSKQLLSIEQQLLKLKKEKDTAQKKANEAINRLNFIKKEKIQVTQDINTLLAQIDNASGKLMDVQSDINAKEEELDITEKQLGETIHHVDQRNELINSRLKVLYMNGSVSYLDVILRSTSFSDFLQRFESILMIINKDKELLDMSKRDMESIKQKKVEMESLLIELKDNYNEAASYRQELLEKEKKKEVLIASLEEEAEELEEYSQEQEDLLMAAARQEAELIRKKAASTQKKTKTVRSGIYIYPLPKTYRMSSGFGSRVDPVTGKKGAFHKGLDFAAPGGTNILASREGTVIASQWFSGYGNAVIIDHGGGVWTLYAHMKSRSVSTGDAVKQGELIGKVGSTGKSTGNHLHFEVRVNEQAVDPKPYLGL
jgi:murein DD-endopeptidase MepM/ murein hydrolase activator NlpD